MIFRKTWKGVRLLAVYYVMSYAVISKEILFEDKKLLCLQCEKLPLSAEHALEKVSS